LLAEGVEVAVPPGLTGIADEAYTIGFRAHHLGLRPQTETAVAMTAEVQVSEITGSESYIHVRHGDVRWVLLAGGVHNLEPGARIPVHLDTRHILVFDAGGLAVAHDPALAA
jgi:glycerol transport system ATP-binding protein